MEIQKGEPQSAQRNMKGITKDFNRKRGWGFITGEDGTDYFVHQSNIKMDGYRWLDKGQEVTFEAGKSDDGRMQAVDVEPGERRKAEEAEQ